MIRSKSSRRSMIFLAIFAAAVVGCGGGGGGSGSGPGAVPTTSTTSTTAASGSTTTTVAGTPASYTVTFRLVSAVTIGSLQVEIDYGGTGGDVVGSGGTVSCTSPLSASGALVAFGDDDSTSTLNIAALKLTGFTGPTSLASCGIQVTGGTPDAGDFRITVVEANAVDTTPLDPPPTVSVSSVVLR